MKSCTPIKFCRNNGQPNPYGLPESQPQSFREVHLLPPTDPEYLAMWMRLHAMSERLSQAIRQSRVLSSDTVYLRSSTALTQLPELSMRQDEQPLDSAIA